MAQITPCFMFGPEATQLRPECEVEAGEFLEICPEDWSDIEAFFSENYSAEFARLVQNYQCRCELAAQ